MKGEMHLECPKTFCNNHYLDMVNASIDVGNCSVPQINTVRKVCNEQLDTLGSQGGLFLFVTHPEFDYAKHWLGVPYNRDSPLLPKGCTKVNCFGPTGASSLSIRDAHLVPSLDVKAENEEHFAVTGKCCICILRMEDAIFQRQRIIVDPDGSVRKLQFQYEPPHRIGFEDGDAFFVAKADPFSDPDADPVTLRYLESGPKHFFFHDEHPGVDFHLSSDELERSKIALPLAARGSRLTVKNAPKGPPDLLETKEGRPWYVFVLAAAYDVDKFKLGIRYNRRPFATTARPLSYDFVECNFCVDTYPFLTGEFDWPPPLPVEWQGDSAFVDYKDVQLVFFRWFEETLFYDGIIQSHLRVNADGLQVWRHGQLVEQR